ncbi:DUF1097 domain-containing protein [Vibrio sp. MarTm2]|uniref:Membrane protein n=3 Tax=Vibrio TaxID=662 RepID=A0A0A5HZ80_PHOS4|nr:MULTISPECIES: DUF1097 domain-containing protein [Vibrio]EED26375.1 chloride channel protein EriC [Vibrio sp. 16]KGY08819.1 membrane protein [Vibrio sinaloensis]KHA59238.1 membrane protein [Vibrio variabilis]KHD25591.1 membrane protein [Vibrio caribbeanicus]KHT47459.1 membrane protein [Vibrio sinaloensis]
MSTLVAIALTTGILSGLWGWLAISLGLLSWAGFLGCTSYFASPTSGFKGLIQSLLTNMTGVFWAMVIIHASQYASLEILGYVITAVVAFLMCMQATQSLLTYIPGTFIGCCATFAASGDWKLVIPSLILGGIFGYLMKASGLWLHQKAHQTQSSAELAPRA